MRQSLLSQGDLHHLPRLPCCRGIVPMCPLHLPQCGQGRLQPAGKADVGWGSCATPKSMTSDVCTSLARTCATLLTLQRGRDEQPLSALHSATSLRARRVSGALAFFPSHPGFTSLLSPHCLHLYDLLIDIHQRSCNRSHRRIISRLYAIRWKQVKTTWAPGVSRKLRQRHPSWR